MVKDRRPDLLQIAPPALIVGREDAALQAGLANCLHDPAHEGAVDAVEGAEAEIRVLRFASRGQLLPGLAVLFLLALDLVGRAGGRPGPGGEQDRLGASPSFQHVAALLDQGLDREALLAGAPGLLIDEGVEEPGGVERGLVGDRDLVAGPLEDLADAAREALDHVREVVVA